MYWRVYEACLPVYKRESARYAKFSWVGREVRVGDTVVVGAELGAASVHKSFTLAGRPPSATTTPRFVIFQLLSLPKNVGSVTVMV